MAESRRDRAVLAFAEKVMTLLDQARTTATYKYAVLLGLMDVCMERASSSGAAPDSVTTRQLAEKVLELYWPQTRGFRGDVVLRQNRTGQAEILSRILRFQREQSADPSGTLARARLRAGGAFEALIRDIEWKLVEMPLPRLQRIGRDYDPFIYEIRWTERIVRSEHENPLLFDNQIRFASDSETGEHLVRLNPLLRPLIEAAWIRNVAAWNRGIAPELELDQFLFGRDRVPTAAVRSALSGLQDNRCFYCESLVRTEPEVDHFLPWARYPTDALENLVVTHRRCNAAKRDHLAAVEHVRHWRSFERRNHAALDAIASAGEWDRAPERTEGVARALYFRQPEGARLWVAGDEFAVIDRDAIRKALAE